MIGKTADPLPDLYESDETAWLDTMANLIQEGRLSDLDYHHLAEYLTDMANRDRREVSSRLRLLLTHVLKWIYQQNMRTPSWRNTVIEQQDELEDLVTKGVLRNHAEESLSAIYQKAVKYAARETGLPAESFPSQCPYTLDQLMSSDILGENYTSRG